MDGQKITCIVCGGEITALINDGVGKCANCGIVYPLDSLEALARQESELITSKDVANVVTEGPDPSRDHSKGAVQASAEVRKEQVSDKNTESSGASFQWETPFATSALGLLCSMSWIALASVWLKNGLDGFAFGLAMMVLYLVGALVYAAYYYPSLFTDAPRLTSSKAVGFCNFLFGGWLFGLIWNHNLTIRNKGISYVVAAVISIASIIVSAFLAFALIGSSLDKPEAVNIGSNEIESSIIAVPEQFRGTYAFATVTRIGEFDDAERPADPRSYNWASVGEDSIQFGALNSVFSASSLNAANLESRGEVVDTSSDRAVFALDDGLLCELWEVDSSYFLTIYESEEEYREGSYKEGYALSFVSKSLIDQGGEDALKASYDLVGQYDFYCGIVDGEVWYRDDLKGTDKEAPQVFIYPGNCVILKNWTDDLRIGHYKQEDGKVIVVGGASDLEFTPISMKDSEIGQFVDDVKVQTSPAAIKKSEDPSHRYICTMYDGAFFMLIKSSI